MKKGALELSFGLIFTVIVIGVVLIVGVFGIINLVGTLDESEYFMFKSDFRSAVEEMRTHSIGTKLVYGGSREPMDLPKGDGEFCILKIESGIGDLPNDKIIPYSEDTGNNIVYSEDLDKSFAIEKLIPEPNPLCFTLGRKISFALEYLGNDEVKISKDE